jgi:YNFM family putative membrane transporter
MAVKGLPRPEKDKARPRQTIGFSALLTDWGLLRIYLCALGGFAIFSSVFNYLPFRLAAAPFHFSTEMTTLLYLVYIVGIFIGPAVGRLSNRFGSGNTLLAGSALLGGALTLILVPAITAVIFGLIGICAGFFTIHAAAVGALNRKLSGGQGRANAIYVLFYYIGGWAGITGAGLAFKHGGWHTLIYTSMLFLILPLAAGMGERTKQSIDQRSVPPE